MRKRKAATSLAAYILLDVESMGYSHKNLGNANGAFPARLGFADVIHVQSRSLDKGNDRTEISVQKRFSLSRSFQLMNDSDDAASTHLFK